MAGNMLMLDVGINSKSAEDGLESLERTLEKISQKNDNLKIGEQLANDAKLAQQRYNDLIQLVEKAESKTKQVFAMAGLKYVIEDITALNQKIKETGAEIDQIELKSIKFDGKELFDIKGIDKSIDKFAKEIDKSANDSLSKILKTQLGDKFFAEQKKNLQDQLEYDMKQLAKNFSQDKLEAYINKYFKTKAFSAAKNGSDTIALNGRFPKEIEQLLNNKKISEQLNANNIDVKAILQQKAKDVAYVKDMKEQITKEFISFLNNNTDANTFGKSYTDSDIKAMTSGSNISEITNETQKLKDELKELIDLYNNFNHNTDENEIYDTVAQIEALRTALKSLGEESSKVGKIDDMEMYKKYLKTVKDTLSLSRDMNEPGKTDDYSEEYAAHAQALSYDIDTLNEVNMQAIIDSSAKAENKISTLKERLSDIDMLIAKINSYNSLAPGFVEAIFNTKDINKLNEQREIIIAGLKKMGVDISGIGSISGALTGGNDSLTSGTGDTPNSDEMLSSEEAEKLKKNYADITAEVEKYKQQITELTAKIKEYRTTADQPDDIKNKLLTTEQALESAKQKIDELNQKISDLNDKLEFDSIVGPDGFVINQEDYDNLTSALEKVKAEAQSAKDELEQLKATSVQVGEGEQVVKAGSPETIKELGEAVKALQERMNKAEEILKDIPEGMSGLKRLSGQIEKMSGNFNEDGSLKNLGTTAEELAEQFKQLENQFDAKIDKKIAKFEKNSYKGKMSNKKFNLAGSLKDLKVGNNKPQNDIADDDPQESTANTQELYKETEAYKKLSEAVQAFNELTSQKIDKTDFDARIKRLQDMQSCVKDIIATVENYEGKANELSALVLKSKNGDISIQDSTKLDALMNKLQSGIGTNTEKKNQMAQAKEDAKKYEAVIDEYNQKFQRMISQKVTSGKQFNVLKQNLKSMSNSVDAIMEKYDTFKGQDFYSSDFANRGEAIRGKIKDASLDLNEISKYKNYEEDIFNIQAKYSESLKKQKQEQDAIAEAARKRAEAEKEASNAVEPKEAPVPENISVAEKSREEQKRKALERQAANNNQSEVGSPSSNILASEVENFDEIDKAVTNLTQHINEKTESIKAEAEEMTVASASEVESVTSISNAVDDLKAKVEKPFKISIGNTPVENKPSEDTTNGTLTESYNVLNENQVASIREQIVAALGENNPIPISFTPNVEGLKKQIADELKKVPIEITNNNIKETLNIQHLKVDPKAFGQGIKNVKIQSFKLTKEAKNGLKTDLGEAMKNVGLSLDTKQLQADVEAAITNAREKAAQRAVREAQRQEEPQVPKPSKSQLNEYDKVQKSIEDAYNAASKMKENVSGALSNISRDLSSELQNTVNTLGEINPLENFDDANVLGEWLNQNKAIIDSWNTLEKKIQDVLKLSNNTAETYSATMSNTDFVSKMSKDLDKIKNKFNDVFSGDQLVAYNSLIEALDKKIQNINSGSSNYNIENIQEIINAMKALNETTDRFTNINKSVNNLDKLLNTLEAAKKNTVNRGGQGDEYYNKITDLIARIEKLKNEQKDLTTGSNKKIGESLGKIESISKEVDELKKKTSDFKGMDNIAGSAEKLGSKFDDLIFKIQDFIDKNSRINQDSGLSAEFNKLMMSVQNADRSAKSLNELTAKFNSLKSVVMSKGLTGRSLGDELSFIASKIGLKAMIGGATYQALNYLKQMISVVRELDTGMTNLKRVSEETESTYQKFMTSAANQARNLGSTMQQVIDATTDFSRLGYNLKEASELANNALMYSNVGDLDINTATDDIVSSMKAFNIAAEDSIKIVDTFNTLGNKYALASADVGQGLRESASALATANNTMEESAAMITAITEITQDSASAGNALKTLSMRLRGASSSLEAAGEDTDGMCNSVSKLREKIKGLSGVDIMLDEDTFKSTYQIMGEIADKWADMSDINRASLLETIAGKTRANQVSALLNNWTTASSALVDSLNSAGSALDESATYVDSIEGRIAQLKASYQKLSNDVIDSGLIKFFVSTGDAIVRATDSLLSFSQIFEKIAPDSSWAEYFDEIKALPTIITAISAGLSIKNKGQKADGILGINMPFVQVTEQMHKPENCWKSLTPFYQSAA
jgi:TP901 family phage tail tape measure protein|nr:MAG TPA: minor tail protein [Caudoviricetes sp.]